MNKDNVLFQLDLLQAYFHNKKSRYPKTYQIIKVYKYNQEARNTHKLLKLSRNDAEAKIKELSVLAFDRKFYGYQTKLVKQLVKVLKKEKQRLSAKLKSVKDSDESKTLTENLLKATDELLQSKEGGILIDNVHHKLVKNILKLYPDLYGNYIILPAWFTDDLNNLKEKNPYKTNTKEVNDVLSKAFADKEVKKEMDISGFEIVWKRKDREVKDYEKDEEDKVQAIEKEYEAQSYREEEEEEEEEEEKEEEEKDVDTQYEEYYETYKDAIAASSDEDESDAELNPSVNYNEVTDEEPSDDDDDEDVKESEKRSMEDNDDFFTSDEPKAKKSKTALPELATGYYSGGESDEEADNDKMVQEVTGQRKNRRGQRARQKIWEKKYGSGAKHVVKNHERSKSEKERLQIEYEQRKTRREERESRFAEKRKEHDAKRKEQEARAQKLGIHHPSWEAKKQAEEKMKNVKFQGKKMTFD